MVDFENYLDYPQNTDPDMKRLSLSLVPPKTNREWVMAIRRAGTRAAINVTFQWNPAAIPANVDLRLFADNGTELANMKSQASRILSIPAAPTLVRFTIRAIAQ